LHGNDWVAECEITLRIDENELTVESVTHRGETDCTVTATYDDEDQLVRAACVHSRADHRTQAAVSVDGARAVVRRGDQAPQSFMVEQGVIVTSAPDWTDALFLCRRFDRGADSPQRFPGLWIHPAEPAQAIEFSIEKVGDDAIDHGEDRVELSRCKIRLRGGSEYAAWRSERGEMVKLVSLPFDESSTVLVLDEFAESAASLVADAGRDAGDAR
jgi:hypothetical protein